MGYLHAVEEAYNDEKSSWLTITIPHLIFQIMRVIASLVLLLTGAAKAFVITNGGVATSRVPALHAYVPDGLSPEQWKAMQAKDKGKKVR